ncbi:MAG: DUF1844 domain-containing protein [Terriglobales bacterium]
MAEKKKDSEFKVSDRRLFTADGELRPSSDGQSDEQSDRQETEQATGVAVAPASAPVAPSAEAAGPARSADASTDVEPQPEAPPPPTATEQKAQQDAYQQSSRDLDRRVELSGHSSKDLEVTFERFMASLYMTAMMQLGLMHEQGGQPGVDLIGARQTIDTLSLIAEKTKGNLTSKEQGFLQNCLYELRMAYVEVTNALARAPQTPGPVTGTNG